MPPKSRGQLRPRCIGGWPWRSRAPWGSSCCSRRSPTRLGRGDDAVGNPHRARISQFELFELILLLKLDNRLPVERFEATVSQSTVSSSPLNHVASLSQVYLLQVSGYYLDFTGSDAVSCQVRFSVIFPLPIFQNKQKQ